MDVTENAKIQLIYAIASRQIRTWMLEHMDKIANGWYNQ